MERNDGDPRADERSPVRGSGPRLSARELTTSRVVAAIRRRAEDLPHRFAWNRRTGRSEANRERLIDLQNRHRGQRCFILGNGPSLAKMDLRPLEEEWTFGLNRIYLLREQMGFSPSYYCASNELVLEQFADDIAALEMQKFVNWNARERFDEEDDSFLFVRQALSLADYFATDLTRPVCSGGTVTYLAMQVAYFMGFHQVVLIGVDHNFVDSGTPNREEVRSQERDANHFHPDYFPRGSRWQLPDLLRSESAYRIARQAFEAEGREILDATLGGALDVFEKVPYTTLVEGAEEAR